MVRVRLLATLGATGAIELGHLELRALPGGNLVDVHPVELLESPTLTLNHAEVDHSGGGEQTTRKDVSIGKVDLAGDEGSEETDQEVPEPVASGGQSHTLRTVLGGEELSTDSPDHGTPGHGVGGNEEAGNDDHTLTRAGGVLRVLDIEHEVANRGEDHEADEHEPSTEDKRLATTEVLDDVQTAEGGTEVDGAEDDLGDEGVGDTGSLEDGGTLLFIHG